MLCKNGWSSGSHHTKLQPSHNWYLKKKILQIILAAKWLVQHSFTSQTGSDDLCLLFCLILLLWPTILTVRQEVIVLTVRQEAIILTVRQEAIILKDRQEAIILTVRQEAVILTVRQEAIQLTVRQEAIQLTVRLKAIQLKVRQEIDF